jgi:hypothetical protein
MTDAGATRARQNVLLVGGMLRSGAWRGALAAGVIAVAVAGDAVAAVPSASTGAARSVTQSSALLTGSVNPNGQPTTYAFQYGATRGYGAATPTQGPTAPGNKNVAVSAGVAGLSPGTTYHYRLVATNASGTKVGGDRTFTTQSGISLAARPSPVVFGSTTLLSGQVVGARAAGARITLRENPFPFTRTRAVATTRADGAGRFLFARRPGFNTQYQVVAATRPSATSGVLTVRVRVKLTLRVGTIRPSSGQRVLFRGTATPAHNGRFVLIQRLQGRAWHTIRRALLTQSATPFVSAFSARVRITRSGLYRARIAHDADHEAGISSTRRMRLR